jgi:hypothetical protein
LASGSSDFCDKPIAAAGVGPDEVAVFSQRLADCRNLSLKGVFLDHRPWPYAAHKLVLGDEFAAGLHQNDKDIECSATYSDGHPVREKLAAAQVHAKAAELRDRRAFTVIHRPSTRAFSQILRVFQRRSPQASMSMQNRCGDAVRARESYLRIAI